MARRKSRKERFQEVVKNIDDARGATEELIDELQNWRDSLPENLQDGEKADQLDEAIGNLENVLANLLDAVEEGETVEFPRMIG